MWKRQRKCLRISNLTLSLVVLKWHHSSKRVKSRGVISQRLLLLPGFHHRADIGLHPPPGVQHAIQPGPDVDRLRQLLPGLLQYHRLWGEPPARSCSQGQHPDLQVSHTHTLSSVHEQVDGVGMLGGGGGGIKVCRSASQSQTFFNGMRKWGGWVGVGWRRERQLMGWGGGGDI